MNYRTNFLLAKFQELKARINGDQGREFFWDKVKRRVDSDPLYRTVEMVSREYEDGDWNRRQAIDAAGGRMAYWQS